MFTDGPLESKGSPKHIPVIALDGDNMTKTDMKAHVIASLTLCDNMTKTDVKAPVIPSCT